MAKKTEKQKAQDAQKAQAKKKKEMILLLVLVFVFGFFLWYNLIRKNPFKQTAGPSVSPSVSTAAQITQPAAPVRIKKEEREVIWSKEWGRSPFALKKVRISRTVALMLEGIIGSEEGRLAIISGEIVGPGDVLGERYTIIEVGPASVVLEDEKGEKETLYLVEEDQEGITIL